MEIKKIRTVFDFTFRDFLELISANPKWELEVMFGPDTPSRSSVQELKELLFDCFKNNGDDWEEMIDFEEFRDKIAAADSIRQILATFQGIPSAKLVANALQDRPFQNSPPRIS